jgi:hypothetical protein
MDVDDALTIFETSSWLRCSMSRACALEWACCFLVLILRSVLANDARVRMDDALSVVRV